MRRFSFPQLLLTLAAATFLWAIVAAACALVGSSGIGIPENIDVFQLRLSSILMSSLVGAALGAAGVAYQAVLRNPLADPYLLGVSSGATLASNLWQFPLALGGTLGALSQQGAAFVGALIAVAIVFGLATRRGRLEPVTLLLVGVIVNAINGSLFLMINALWPQISAQAGGPLSFLVGGIQTNLLPAQKIAVVIVCTIGYVVLTGLADQLNVAGLSEAEALSLGVRIHRLRWMALLCASLMTASAVAISGPIGFVGLVCPHLARLAVGHDNRRVLPLATAMAAALLAAADSASRAMIHILHTWPPVGVLTGLLGGPFFLFLLWRRREAP